MKTYLSILLITTLLSGCAISRKVQYNNLDLELSLVKIERLSIAVWDQREQIIDGTRKPDFVGYMRSAVGIAYPIGTLSSKPFADDIALDISTSYKNDGIQTIMVPTSFSESENTVLDNLKNSNSNKLILVKLNKLHTDGYTGHDLFYDLQTKVFNSNGELLEQVSFEGTKPLGKATKYKTYHPVGLKELLEEVFNDARVLSALNDI
jgi:hypothetical protein